MELHDFIIDDVSIGLSFTSGISTKNTKTPLIEANTAIAYAKSKHLSVVVYSEIKSIVKQQQNNITWAQKVRKALVDKRIIPYYQAIFSNKTGLLAKAEALVRLIDEDGSVITPFYFLDAAKQSHQYEELTKAVLLHSIEEVAAKKITVTINFTIEDTQSDNLYIYFKNLLDQYQCAEFVVIEIVEDEAVDNYAKTANFIKKIQVLGCKVAIDDFGSGYSNFMHVISLKANILKIDGSIIKKLLDDPNAEILVKTIVSLAKKMKMKTVAEFVNSKEILEKVIELKVDYSQGFYLAKPQVTLIKSIDKNILN